MWEEFEILSEDLSGLKFADDAAKPEEQECSAAWTRMRTQSALVDASYHNTSYDWLLSEKDETYDSDRWESWLHRQNAPRSNENHLSIVIAQPAYLIRLGKTATDQVALRHVSLPEDRFRDVLYRMRIHPSFLGAVKGSGPVATQSSHQVDGKECVVYIFRVSNCTTSQTAMAIAFHPGETKPGTQEGGCRISALILGYDRRDTSLFEDFLRQRRRSIFEPATIIMAFLEVEKEKRFGEVRRRRSGLRRILHRTSSEEVIVTRPDRHKDVDDNVGMYIHVSDLVVDALQTWRRQILSLETQVVGGNPRLALELRQLALQYEHRLDRCDKILQGASLAYQMETTYLSRRDASTAIADGKRVKAIALLTMIFLPATFTAALMAVPQIERAIDAQKVFGNAEWIWYLVLSLSFTGLVLALYLTWGCTSFFRKRKGKASTDGDDIE